MSRHLHDPLMSGRIMINNQELTATAQEINDLISPTIAPISVTSNFTPSTAAHHGRTLLLDNAAGLTVTFPNATGSGATYRFVTLTGLTSGNIIFQVAANTDGQFVGILNRFEFILTPPYDPLAIRKVSDIDTITLTQTANGGFTGDEMIFQDIDTDVWFLAGRIICADTSVNPLTSVITAP